MTPQPRSSADAALLGIDIGTSATKGVLTRTDGTVVARAERSHAVDRPAPGRVEQDPVVWWTEIVGICRELSARFAERLAAVAVTGMGPCLVATDADGRPLRPAILYGVDTRAGAEIGELTDRLGADEVLRRCGSPLTSQAAGPKLWWLRRHEPQVWSATERVFSSSSWAVRQLTGEYVLDHHSASQFTPLYDLPEAAWTSDWSAEIAPGLALPRLVWPSDLAGTVTDGASEATGIPAGTPVAAGTVDAWAEAVGSGAARPGDLLLMYGTTMFLVLTTDSPAPRATIWNTAGVFPGSYSRAAGMATSGAITSWWRDITGGDYSGLAAAAAGSPVGSRGLVTLPYFAGERTPLFDPRARGAVFGLTLQHTGGDIYRSMLEATGYAVRHNLEHVLAADVPRPRMVAAGGGVQAAIWPQIVSDITGLEQLVPAEHAGACYGAALLAGIAGAGLDEHTDWARTERTVTPVAEHADRYDQLYRIYRDLYPATLVQMHTLAELQASDIDDQV